MFGSIGTIWAEIGVNTKKLDQGIMAAQTKLANFDKTANTFGQKLTNQSTKLITAGGLMAGAVAAVGISAVKMAKDFDTSMRNVNSIAKLSEAEFAKMSGEVLELSTKLPQSAKVLADGLYDISSSGFAGADGLKVLEASAKAASAGMTNTATSAKGITAVLNAYGLEAEDAAYISDVMFKTVDKGVITFEELSGTIGDVVSTANIANISIEELSGMLGYVTTKGLSAAEATTALNRLILSIIKPSEELAGVLADAGYQSGEMAIKALGLTGVLELMDKAAGGSLTKLQEMSPEMRALKASGALLGEGIEELNGYMADFKDVTGATNTALEEQSKSLDYQLNLLKNNISAIGITLGSELVPQAAQTVGSMSKWINKNKDLSVSLTKIIGGGVAGAGGLMLLLGIIGKIRSAIIALNATPFMAGLGGTGPFMALIVGIMEFIYATKTQIQTIKEWEDESVSFGEKMLKLAYPMTALGDTAGKAAEVFGWTTDEIDKLNHATENAQSFMKNYADEVPNATAAMGELLIKYQDGQISTKAFVIGIDELREATKNGRVDIDNLAESGKALANEFDGLTKKQLREHKEAQNEVKTYVEKTTKSFEQQQEMLESLFKTYNFNQSVIESTWALEDAMANYYEVLKDSNATEREKQEALFAVQDEFELLANITIPELTTKVGKLTDEERKHLEGMQDQIDKALELGIIEEEQWNNISDDINNKIQNSILQDFADMYNEMGRISATEVKPKVDLDTSEFYSKLAKISDEMRKMGGWGLAYGSGGIVGMASGGIIGQGYDQPILTAATGLITPQTGRTIPILAHEGEVILNTSQQKNLAQAIWGAANGKGDSSDNPQPIQITNILELDGQVIYEKTSEYLYNGQRNKLIGSGIK